MAKREPRSPWQRKQKVKYAYSPTYNLWHSTAKAHGAGNERAIALSCQHAKQFGYRNEACVG